MARNDASKYREFYVHGTAAYNRQVAPSEIVRDEPIYVPPRKRIEETVAANTQALTKQSLSPMVMLGFVIAVAMLVFCLIARIEFTTVSAEAAELQSQLNQLTEDNSRLTIKYESALNLAEVEDYAVNTLGMQRPSTDQIIYVNGSAQNRAEVVNPNTEQIRQQLDQAAASIAGMN